MRKSYLFLFFIVVFITLDCHSQYKYNEYDELVSYSYFLNEVAEYKQLDKINSFLIQGINCDSIWWEHLIPEYFPENLNKENGHLAGLSIDTNIKFFDVATEIKIKDGYLWMYKISGCDANKFGFRYLDFPVDTNEYLSVHTDYFDTIPDNYSSELPEIIEGKNSRQHYEQGYLALDTLGTITYLGKEIYIEFFSPSKKAKKKEFKITGIIYGFHKTHKLKDAPNWVREKYPQVNYENK